MTALFITGYIKSDNDLEFIAENVGSLIEVIGTKMAYIEFCSPWENGYYKRVSGP